MQVSIQMERIEVAATEHARHAHRAAELKAAADRGGPDAGGFARKARRVRNRAAHWGRILESRRNSLARAAIAHACAGTA